MHYNIVYSLLVYTEIDCVNKLLDNIFKYNNNLTFLVVINTNCNLNIERSESNIIINNQCFEKKTNTHLILKGHLSNSNFVKDISYNYFCMLASNCIFIKNINFNLIDNKYKEPLYIEPYTDLFDFCNINNNSYIWYHWPYICRNKKILVILKNKNVKKLFKSWHEGLIINKDDLNNIYDFIINNKIFENLENETVFEEFLIQTLNVFLNKKNTFVICEKIYFTNENIPKLIDLIKDNNGLHHIIKMNGKQLNNCNSSRSEGMNELYNFFNQYLN